MLPNPELFIPSAGWVPILILAAAVALVLTATARAARRLIIWSAQFFAFFALALAIVAGVTVGNNIGTSLAQSNPANPSAHLFPVGGVILGGIAGFALGSLVLSLLFTLYEIAENTRPTK